MALVLALPQLSSECSESEQHPLHFVGHHLQPQSGHVMIASRAQALDLVLALALVPVLALDPVPALALALVPVCFAIGSSGRRIPPSACSIRRTDRIQTDTHPLPPHPRPPGSLRVLVRALVVVRVLVFVPVRALVLVRHQRQWLRAIEEDTFTRTSTGRYPSEGGHKR